MEIEAAETELKRIFAVYPSFRQWIIDNTTDKESSVATFNSWVSIIANCESSDVTAVVDDIVTGKTQLRETQFEKPDQLPFTVSARARDRAGKRLDDQRHQETIAAGTSRGAWAAVARTEIGHLAITCGAMSKSGAITRAENKARMDDLFAWQAGSGKPDWVDEAIEWSNKHERAKPFQQPRTPTDRENFERQRKLMKQAQPTNVHIELKG